MTNLTRRTFVRNAALGLTASGMAFGTDQASAQDAGERPENNAADVKVLNPRNRVPLSFIIDDSTCLVNLAHFGIPQFAEAFPERY